MVDRFNRPDAERSRELVEIEYVAALERGDFEAIAAILEEAFADPELDRRIVSIDLVLHAEAGLQAPEEQARVIRELLIRHLPSAIPETEESVALTIGMVAVRLAEEARGSLSPADRLANLHLIERTDSLESPVTSEVVARLSAATDVTASQRYWEQFRRMAAKLAIARQHGEVELAAARRQTRGRNVSTGRESRKKQGRS
jgi:hypothetical protein